MPNQKMPGEFDLIRRYLAPLSAKVPGAFALTDDAAVLPPRPGLETVVTMDTLVAGVHFLETTRPEDIAAKAIRVNLSDLTAMGADPAFYTLSLALPKNGDIDADWLERFCQSLGAEQELFGVSIIGGDTVSTPGPLTVTLTAFGYVEQGQAIKRSTANQGDLVVVSGTIGDAALGLEALRGQLERLSQPASDFLISQHNRPQPQVKLGRRLRSVASAAIDVSDGLLQDLGHICTASHVAALVELDKVPVSPALEEAIGLSPRNKIDVLSGGDDYQLLFTLPSSRELELEKISQECQVNLTVIGKIQQESPAAAESTVRVVDEEGKSVEVTATGFRHF